MWYINAAYINHNNNFFMVHLSTSYMVLYSIVYFNISNHMLKVNISHSFSFLKILLENFIRKINIEQNGKLKKKNV